MKPSEYGGADTHKTDGIQPAPHQVTPEEHLRLLYKTDSEDLTAGVPSQIAGEATT